MTILRKSSRLIGLVVGLFIMLATVPDAMASHLAGADLFYVHLGGLRYRVTLRIYRDCSGINLTNETLNVTEGRCGPAAANVVGAGTQAPTRRDTQDIFCDSYDRRFICSGQVDPSNPNRPTNFEAVEYVFNVTLPGRRRNWCFSWSQFARPAVNNLGTGSSGEIYIDAILNNLDFDGNNSAFFEATDVPLPYVCVNEPFTYNFNTRELDGDSLEYRLEAPRTQCNTFSTYGRYAPGVLLDTTDPNRPRVAFWNAGNFSATFPISSWQVSPDPTNPNRSITRPFFLFNPRNGSTTFIPRVFVPTTNTADPDNKHSMLVRITERRRDFNGVWRIAGETVREVLITVVDCGGNKPPGVPGGTVPPNTNGSITVRRDTNVVEIKAQTCTYTVATINFLDSNATGNLDVRVPTNIGIPSRLGTFRVLGLGTNKPRGVFSILPAASDAGSEYSFTVVLDNNACPVKGIKNVVVVLRIVNENFGNVIKPGGSVTSKDTICLGDSTVIQGRVSRPDTSVGGAPITYSYTWTVAPGLRERDTTRQSLTVVPPATMRYRFRADNSLFPGCIDTASVLVVVRPPVTPIIRSFYSSSRPGVSTEAPVQVRFQNGSYPLTDADQTRWYMKRYQRSGDTLALDSNYGAFSYRIHPDSLFTLEEPGVYVVQMDIDTRTKSSARCYATAYDTIVVPEPALILPNVVSPNGDGVNEVLRFKVPGNDLTLSIFNRYGVLVKRWEKYTNDYIPSELAAGSYFYLAKDNTTGQVTRSWLEIVK